MKITELVVGPADYKALPSADGAYAGYSFHTEYERIEERGWGCLNPDSPTPGLCTDLVDTCFVFVFHCEANGRTTLCHTVSGIDTAVFDAQMNFVMGENLHPQVDIIVFKGHIYGDPEDTPPEIPNEDLTWASEALDRIKIKTPSCNTSIHPKPLDYGVVLVQKSSGNITLPIRPSRAHYPLPTPKLLQCFSSPPTLEALDRSRLVEMFHRIQSTASFIASSFTSIPCFKVYDGTCRLAIPPSSDDTREIFRIATMHPDFPSFAPIRQSDLDICTRVVKTKEMWGYVKGLTQLIQRVGAPCEAAECRQLTTNKCAKCMGAHYCGRTHQVEDWANHKGWCKSHRFIPGGFPGMSMGAGSDPFAKSGERPPWM
ncbi:hypothetical protein DFH07DRAFT_826039 [Mycena maculata]|uniref:MYND-type domain-containing protein n=1 Tax=Mycena maculata TaxID=230809 RepID=A0AAD7IW10_9AGAR|nr:hypothetical protein DFH07DRAFT_826039 [Mycena maculata]